jgi:hypothetical protein
LADNAKATGPLEVVTDLDTTARTGAFQKTFEFMPTAGVAYLQVDHAFSLLGSAAAGYVVGCAINDITVWYGGSAAYTVYGWAQVFTPAAAARDALMTVPPELTGAKGGFGGQLMELNRWLFGAPCEEHSSTVSANAAQTPGIYSYFLPVFKPRAGVDNKKIKVVINFATPNTAWSITGAGMTGTVNILNTTIMCQYADQMPEFEYINYGRTGLGASLVKSTDYPLDQKPADKKIIGVISQYRQAGVGISYITRLGLVDTNGTPWAEMTREQMAQETMRRSAPYWVKTGVTTGIEVPCNINQGMCALKVDGVESNGKLKLAVYTAAAAAAGILDALVLLRGEGAPVMTSPGKAPTLIKADQSGAGSANKV